MSLFIVICVLLVLASALFLYLPFTSGQVENDPGKANLQWYRRRQAELALEEDEGLREDARLRLLEDEPATQSNLVGQVSDTRLPRWALVLLVAVMAGVIYYQLGGARDVLIAQRLQGLDESTPAAEMEELMLEVSDRARQRPDNLHYAALLGRYYMGQEEYALAADLYADLAARSPEDAQALAYAAQAHYLAAQRQLDDRSRMLAERALAIDPHQRTALGLLGMASFEQGRYRAAIAYWERLLAQEAPESDSARMIASVIGMARQKLGDDAGPAPEPGLGVTVSVFLPQGAELDAGDTVFVLARNAESDSRMPVAVQRLAGAQLPLTVRLDDGNSMAGQKLSELASVLVLVQVSPDGRPGEEAATWLGRAGPLAPSAGTEPVAIELARNRP